MYISDGKTHLSYSLLCSSALSNEERKNIVRKFKSNQRKRKIYNKYNDHYLQLKPANKKQRYSLMDRAKKEDLLETCAKKYKEIDVSKKKQCLKIEEKSIKRWMHQKRNKCLTEKLLSLEREKYQNGTLKFALCNPESHWAPVSST